MAVKKIVSKTAEPVEKSSVPLVNVPSPVTQTPPPISTPSTPVVGKMGFMQKIQALLFHPFAFMTYLQQEQGFIPAMFFWAEVAAITYVLSATLNLVLQHTLVALFAFFISLIMYPTAIFLFGIPSTFLAGLILHGFLKLFRGQGEFGDTMRAYYYASVPVSLLGIILAVVQTSITAQFASSNSILIILAIFLVIGWLAIAIYGSIIESWFFAAVHKISKLAAAGAVFLVGAIFATIVFVIAFMIAAMIGFSLSRAGGWSGLLDSLSSSTQVDYVTTINQIDAQRLDASAKVSNLESKSPEDGWTADERQQFGQFLLSLDALHAMLNAAKVPDSYSAVNTQFLEALSGYQAANEQYRVALAANDEKAMTAAIETFARADELYVHAHQTFEALVKDPKAGMSSSQSDLQGTLKQGFSGGFMQGLSGGSKAY